MPGGGTHRSQPAARLWGRRPLGSPRTLLMLCPTLPALGTFAAECSSLSDFAALQGVQFPAGPRFGSLQGLVLVLLCSGAAGKAFCCGSCGKWGWVSAWGLAWRDLQVCLWPW